MLIIEHDREESGSSQLANGIASIMCEVGTPRFEPSLANVGQALLQCHQITAFTFNKQHVPQEVGLFARERADKVRHAAKRYETVHWRHDPSNYFLDDASERRRSIAVLLSKADIDDTDFLDDCYIEPDVGHRLSLISDFDGRPVKLSFHRRERYGEFDHKTVEQVLEHSRTLMSLILKHVEITQRRNPNKTEQEIFEDALETNYPGLTRRERAVCGLIAIGLSSEAIALTLGISINTVLTFRRRAYSRLNISTQNELLRMLYRACTTWC